VQNIPFGGHAFGADYNCSAPLWIPWNVVPGVICIPIANFAISNFKVIYLWSTFHTFHAGASFWGSEPLTCPALERQERDYITV
jgi:hypothetical protein